MQLREARLQPVERLHKWESASITVLAGLGSGGHSDPPWVMGRAAAWVAAASYGTMALVSTGSADIVRPDMDEPRPPFPEPTETRSRITETALQLFVSQGFAETTIDEIAKVSGVGRRTIFRYFPTKEAMLLDHLVARRERIVEMVRARPAVSRRS